MAKAQVTYVEIQASSSYVVPRSSITYSDIKSSVSYTDLSATEVVLDPDTLNRYFRDEAFGISDVPALTAGKNFTDLVGSFSDQLETIGVGKNPKDTLAIGDFAFVLLTIQRSFTEALSLGDVSSLSAGLNRTETLIANEVLNYAFAKTATDSVSAADLFASNFSAPKAETVTAVDLFARVLTISRAFNDTITLDDFTDVDAFTKDTIGAKSNAISFSDTQTFSTAKGVTDTPTMSDLYTSVFVTSRAENVSVTESLTVFNRSLASSRLNAGSFNTATLNN